MVSKIEKLEQQRDQVNARLQRERARETQRRRKLETRKKILIGGAILAEVKAGRMEQGKLDQLLDLAVTRRGDRALLGLPPLDEGS